MKKKVLAVDDSSDILDVVKDMLTPHSYEVSTAQNGAEALSKYVSIKPDLVTLDVSMPVMNGVETLSKILKIDNNARVIMLTALEDEGLLKQCLSKGAIGYITKPFSEKDLLYTVTRVFSLDYNKYVNAFFSQVCKTLDVSIKKMVHPLASVTLNNVELIQQEEPVQRLTSSDLSQIKYVPMAQQVQLEIPSDAIGYISKFKGQKEGLIISFIEEKHLSTLFDNNVKKSGNSKTGADFEFFNIINFKVLSHLANSQKIRLEPEPVTLYNKETDRPAISNDILKAKLDINLAAKTVPLEIQLWCDL